MDIAWEEYRPLLRRAYFGEHDGAIAPRESQVANDFNTFHKKYVAYANKKGVCADLPSTSAEDYPMEKYTKHRRCNVKFVLDKTAKYSLRQVPSNVVREFEYSLAAFLQFNQKQSFGKLKRLRQTQQQLPIAEKRNEIIAALEANDVLIIAGDTGCGKSTQVPQYLMSAGYTNIACTQPRRIACISLSKRVAHETLNEYGTRVAYAIRFDKTRTLATRLLFLTDGLLLRQMHMDAQLLDYQVILLDEVHERHITGDLLIGLLRMLAVQRATGDHPLKLILMSATINLKLFTEYFPDAPVIQVPGRLYPIQVSFMPVKTEAERRFEEDDKGRRKEKKKKIERIDPAPYQRVLQMIDGRYPSGERGDVLIFLSGINEIQTVAEVIKAYAEETKKWIILMLHSTLSLEEQDRVFDIAPDGVRKCILSTNIGETSVTIDGIRFVVDSGKVKLMTYDASTRTHQLKEVWISKASSEQRKGRAGRTGPGVCYRMYSASDYEKFESYTSSEIHRVSLQSVAMQIYNLDLGVNPREFPFIEKPDLARMTEAIECLRDQRALKVMDKDGGEEKEEEEEKEGDKGEDDSDIGPLPISIAQLTAGSTTIEELTPLGRVLVNLPVDVPIGKMLIVGCLFGEVEAMLTMAAGLSVQSVFMMASFRDPDAVSARESLISNHGDSFSLVQTRMDGSDYTRRWCRTRGIEEQRLYDISKLRAQFGDLLLDADLTKLNELSQAAGEAKTSHERKMRAGEMKRLRDMKRKARTDQRKRKVLKRDAHFDSAADGNDDLSHNMQYVDDNDGTKSQRKGDVHSLEFDLRHTDEQLLATADAHRLTHRRAVLLKFILASGLYPLYGMLDKHNQFKQGTDLMVHTMTKPFAVLHPNGCLAHDPQALAHTTTAADSADTHQLIFYSMLLETTKPYLVNCVRVPALHTLLLLARKVDCSADYTRVLCDDFIEFTCGEADKGKCEKACATASRLRVMITKTLDESLSNKEPELTSRDLCRKLDKYFSHTFLYTQALLTHTERERQALLKARSEVRDEKGRGEEFNVGAVGSSLLDGTAADTNSSYASFISRKWTCDTCLEDFYSNPQDRLAHIAECSDTHETAEELRKREKEAVVEAAKPPSDPTLKAYKCVVCNELFYMKPIDILKHKRTHVMKTEIKL